MVSPNKADICRQLRLYRLEAGLPFPLCDGLLIGGEAVKQGCRERPHCFGPIALAMPPERMRSFQRSGLGEA